MAGFEGGGRKEGESLGDPETTMQHNIGLYSTGLDKSG
jgi:hypothetical protein